MQKRVNYNNSSKNVRCFEEGWVVKNEAVGVFVVALMLLVMITNTVVLLV